jgi:hypothetical protein
MRYRIQFPAGTPDLSLFQRSQTGSGAHPGSYLTGTGFFPGRWEAGHSSPSTAKVKNVWIYASTSPYVFMALCLIKHGDNFALAFRQMLGSAQLSQNPFSGPNFEPLQSSAYSERVIHQEIHFDVIRPSNLCLPSGLSPQNFSSLINLLPVLN